MLCETTTTCKIYEVFRSERTSEHLHIQYTPIALWEYESFQYQIANEELGSECFMICLCMTIKE